MAGERRSRPRQLLRVKAPAKINLSLRVMGASTDGYHELRTVFQSIALHDTLTIEAGAGPFRLECDDPACPADRTNLVWRAAEAIARAAGGAGPPRDIIVRIRKRIPVQAGLGGGSSDAAAVLRAFASLWRVAIPPHTMRAIAAALGADVPFFLEGGTVLGLARGDLLFPLLDRPPAWVTLVIPRFGVSTPDAYGWWDEVVARRKPRGRWEAGAAARAGAEGAETVNDLQGPVVQRHPEIARIIAALTREGAGQAALSGSGSAVFGIFGTRAAAMRAARAAGTAASRRTLVTRTINRVQYQALAGP